MTRLGRISILAVAFALALQAAGVPMAAHWLVEHVPRRHAETTGCTGHQHHDHSHDIAGGGSHGHADHGDTSDSQPTRHDDDCPSCDLLRAFVADQVVAPPAILAALIPVDFLQPASRGAAYLTSLGLPSPRGPPAA